MGLLIQPKNIQDRKTKMGLLVHSKTEGILKKPKIVGVVYQERGENQIQDNQVLKKLLQKILKICRVIPMIYKALTSMMRKKVKGDGPISMLI